MSPAPQTHCAFTQSLPTGQVIPQPPQLFESTVSGMQLPLQNASPAGQVHAPATQDDPPPQTRPQAPQLSTSVWRFTHAPLQFVTPAAAGQETAHLPLAQTSLAGQTVAQAPQWVGFDARSTHCPPQSAGCAPPSHAQARSTHCWPAAHTTPQAPQWPGFVVRSTHAPAQSVSAGPASVAQDDVHAPLRQTALAPHATSHPPQFAGSVNVSTHPPLQSMVVPAGHTAPSGKVIPTEPSTMLASSAPPELELVRPELAELPDLEIDEEELPPPVGAAASPVTESERSERPHPAPSSRIIRRASWPTASITKLRVLAPSEYEDDIAAR
jgi:hypothetical protein